MRFYLLLAGLTIGEILASNAFASISISLSGSGQTTTSNLEKTTEHSVSANVGLSLGQYFSVGVTQRRVFSSDVGYKKGISADQKSFIYNSFREDTQTLTNSVDLTIIPYQGVVSPFFFGGVARRDYYNQFDYQGVRITNKTSLYPVPNYGGGLSIQLGQNFSFKVTETFSPGKQMTVDDKNVEHTTTVRDSYTEFGLGYKF
ncbi:MAG: hypothetical protein H7249_03875 [Chitinophagaceae bacterium]|nr:hypothetical protein [Oligoflexus sp.]